jgi:hypothetical protein
MARHWIRLGLVVAVALATPSAAARLDDPAQVDVTTKEQLTVAARVMLERRSEALVDRARPLPAEVFGVRIAPQVASAQEDALRRLEGRNRAPVEGGPPFTSARTRLQPGRATRAGDRITLDATEYTEVRYQTPQGERAMRQRVRRRFEFTAGGGELVLVGERVVDPTASPINDPERPNHRK